MSCIHTSNTHTKLWENQTSRVHLSLAAAWKHCCESLETNCCSLVVFSPPTAFPSPAWRPTFPSCSWTWMVTVPLCHSLSLPPSPHCLSLLSAEDFHQSYPTAPLAGGLDAQLGDEDDDEFFHLHIVKHFDPEVKRYSPNVVDGHQR